MLNLWVDSYDVCLTVSSITCQVIVLTYLLSYFSSVFKTILKMWCLYNQCFYWAAILEQICIMYFPLITAAVILFFKLNLISTFQILKQYLLVPSSVSFKMHNCFFLFPHPLLLSVCWTDWDSKQICKIFRKDEIKCSLSCHL